MSNITIKVFGIALFLFAGGLLSLQFSPGVIDGMMQEDDGKCYDGHDNELFGQTCDTSISLESKVKLRILILLLTGFCIGVGYKVWNDYKEGERREEDESRIK